MFKVITKAEGKNVARKSLTALKSSCKVNRTADKRAKDEELLAGEKQSIYQATLFIGYHVFTFRSISFQTKLTQHNNLHKCNAH